MAKLKTHKGLSKAVNVRKGGTITFRSPGCNHNTGKRSSKRNNRNDSDILMDKTDIKRLRNLIKK